MGLDFNYILLCAQGIAIDLTVGNHHHRIYVFASGDRASLHQLIVAGVKGNQFEIEKIIDLVRQCQDLRPEERSQRKDGEDFLQLEDNSLILQIFKRVVIHIVNLAVVFPKIGLRSTSQSHRVCLPLLIGHFHQTA